VAESENSTQTIFCHIRKILVKKTPEEEVRQNLLREMLSSWGYPPSSIIVEKAISHLPHLQGLKSKLPLRRMDIVCYAKKETDLFPLLVIECKKAGPISKRTYLQLLGYNHYVQAKFIGFATGSKLEILSKNSSSSHLHLVEGEPTYQSLISLL
jgi:hypothetical protein